MVEPRIEITASKRLAGKQMAMSFADNKTDELWKSLMQQRREISNNINQELISMQVYPPEFFTHFHPATTFDKWATVEVSDFDHLPNGMETYTLPKGLYAVFQYRGKASDAAPFFQYILGTWLPQSGYLLDDRPHFEILGEKYKNNSPDSEEEIWIPVKKKDDQHSR